MYTLVVCLFKYKKESESKNACVHFDQYELLKSNVSFLAFLD